MRMTRPIRSSKCGHIQCFDATWWIESNAVHPQWLCPHCSKELRFDDLIVDGCFLVFHLPLGPQANHLFSILDT